MNSRFRLLDQLERDLREAAEREISPDLAPLTRPRRPARRVPGDPRRRASWGTIAAAVTILLVLAGAVGGLSELGGGRFDGSADGGSAAEAPAAGAPRDGDATQSSGYERGPGTGSFIDPAAGSGRTGDGASVGQDLSKVVRDGAITVVVAPDGFGNAFDRTTAIAEDAGGFVLSSSISQERQGTLTLRVPAGELDATVVRLRELGRLAELSLSGTDVTAEYIDLRSRLGVLKTQRDLILELLDEATTVSGTLGLSNRYTSVQTQIERLQGSLNVLNDHVDLATLKVTLREEGVATPDEDDIRNPSLGSAWDRAVQGFVGVIAAVVVGLGYLLPLLALAGVVLLGRAAFIRRRAAS